MPFQAGLSAGFFVAVVWAYSTPTPMRPHPHGGKRLRRRAKQWSGIFGMETSRVPEGR